MIVPLLLDMNIPPSWVGLLREEGIPAVHWIDTGMPHNTPDETVMAYARTHGQAVLTYDLDFTRLLALTYATGPSVVLLRRQYTLPQQQTVIKVARAVAQHATMLASGALIVVDAERSRVRALPLHYMS